MIAMDVEFLSGKFRLEWNEGRFVVLTDKVVLEPREFMELAQMMQDFYITQMGDDGCCCECP
jgi:hypothetical protein